MNNLVNIKDIEINEIKDLWNEEVGFIFPISDRVFNANIVNSQDVLFDASFAVLIDGKVKAFIITKIWDNNNIISSYNDTGWISLFYVSRNYRRKGFGTLLFDKAEEELIKRKVKRIHIGRDLNNFFPGIPSDFDNLTSLFLEKRGYECSRYTHDLIKNDISNIEDYEPKNNIRYLIKEEYSLMLEFMEKNFFGRWYYEVKRALDADCFRQFLVCLNEGKIVGFLRLSYPTDKVFPYSQTWADRFLHLGGVGPLGVDVNYRKQGIAKELILFGLTEMKKKKVTNIMIDWTGLMEIYQKFGFEVWKTYQYASKEIINTKNK